MTDLSGPYPVGDNLQTFEHDGKILIAIVDRTYTMSADDEWEAAREQFRLDLEAEHQMRFEDGNVGPSADLPAFLALLDGTTEVPNWAWLIALFLAGKPINDNLDAWSKLFERLRPLLRLPAVLNQRGAAVIAVEAITAELGRAPEHLQLHSYRIMVAGDPTQLEDLPPSREILPAVPTLYLGFMSHVFDIEADDILFRVRVDGNRSELLRPSAPANDA